MGKPARGFIPKCRCTDCLSPAPKETLSMCMDLLADAGHDPAAHDETAHAMALAADLAAVDAAYEVMRQRGLPTLADREQGGRDA